MTVIAVAVFVVAYLLTLITALAPAFLDNVTTVLLIAPVTRQRLRYFVLA